MKALNERAELESKIEYFIEKWKNRETFLSNELVQDAMEKGYERLEGLRKIEGKLHTEYMAQEQKDEEKRLVDISVEYKLGERPTNMNIVGGVLSSNANESHLIAEQKSPEQLKQEKSQMLEKIKLKVQNGEISLAEASKLTHDVNIAFCYYDEPTEINTNEIHR